MTFTTSLNLRFIQSAKDIIWMDIHNSDGKYIFLHSSEKKKERNTISLTQSSGQLINDSYQND